MQKNKTMISYDILNKFIYGEPSPEEVRLVLNAISEDHGVAEYIRNAYAAKDMADQINAEAGMDEIINARLAELQKEDNIYSQFLPMTSLAAADSENMCDLKCESLILSKYDINYDIEHLKELAQKYAGFEGDGVSIYNIGKLLQTNPRMFVSRRFRQNLSDILELQARGYQIIAVVNENKLHLEEDEDLEFEDFANHAVVVLSVDKDTVTLYNPSTDNESDTYPVDTFLKAWADSRCFIASAKMLESEDEYEPYPIDVSDIELDPSLDEVKEAIAETAHEIWAKDRKREGWKYGPVKKQVTLPDGTKDWRNQDLRPYNWLDESEKDYDRKMAMNTIKLVQLLGFKITNLHAMKHCPDCGGAIELQDQYCRHCGKPLMNEDFK